jgi:hypothetical protein
MIIPLPLLEQVVAVASHTCCCTGQCGSKHTSTAGKCDVEQGALGPGGRVRLLAAPATREGLLLPAHRAAALPAADLIAWCPACHKSAASRAASSARKAAAAALAAAPDLFGQSA